MIFFLWAGVDLSQLMGPTLVVLQQNSGNTCELSVPKNGRSNVLSFLSVLSQCYFSSVSSEISPEVSSFLSWFSPPLLSLLWSWGFTCTKWQWHWEESLKSVGENWQTDITLLRGNQTKDIQRSEFYLRSEMLFIESLRFQSPIRLSSPAINPCLWQL